MCSNQITIVNHDKKIHEDGRELTVETCENGTKPRRPSTSATTPPLLAPTTCLLKPKKKKGESKDVLTF